MFEAVSVEKLKTMVGRDNGTSDWVLIDQERVNRFADATDDHQWIHVDIEQARKGPFSGTIAHGFLTLSLIPLFTSSGKYLPEGMRMAVNYGLNKVRFIAPVPVGSRIRSKMAISGVEEKEQGRLLVTITHTIEIEGQDKPACIAEALAMFMA
ncbi:MAG: enoyl-CoA hydratase [Deltaproteobacteria bacterium HGW-Deltaproteobacteria-13]|jgi:acyl dehydratase|nr:MAG: enoyl-CoA hydratase [Deltaproteobacteria bacterium HGW-Deltaproteobacteria-13]